MQIFLIINLIPTLTLLWKSDFDQKRFVATRCFNMGLLERRHFLQVNLVKLAFSSKVIGSGQFLLLSQLHLYGLN